MASTEDQAPSASRARPAAATSDAARASSRMKGRGGARRRQRPEEAGTSTAEPPAQSAMPTQAPASQTPEAKAAPSETSSSVSSRGKAKQGGRGRGRGRAPSRGGRTQPARSRSPSAQSVTSVTASEASTALTQSTSQTTQSQSSSVKAQHRPPARPPQPTSIHPPPHLQLVPNFAPSDWQQPRPPLQSRPQDQPKPIQLKPVDELELLKFHQAHILPMCAEDPRLEVREILLSDRFKLAGSSPIQFMKQVTAPSKGAGRGMSSEERRLGIRLLARLVPTNRQLREWARPDKSRWHRTLCDTILGAPVETGDVLGLDDLVCAIRALTVIAQPIEPNSLPSALGRAAGTHMPDYVLHRSAQLVESIHANLPVLDADVRSFKRLSAIHDLVNFLDLLNLSVSRTLALLTPLTLRTAAQLVSFTKPDAHSAAHRDCILATSQLLYDLRTDTAIDETKTLYEMLAAEDLPRLSRVWAGSLEMMRSAERQKDPLVKERLWQIGELVSWAMAEMVQDERMVTVILEYPTVLPLALSHVLEPAGAQLHRPVNAMTASTEATLITALNVLGEIMEKGYKELLPIGVVVLLRDAHLLQALAGATLQLASRRDRVLRPVLRLMRAVSANLRKALLISVGNDQDFDRLPVPIVQECAPAVLTSSPKAVRFIAVTPPSQKLELLRSTWLDLVDAADLSDDPRCMFCVGCSGTGCQYRCSRCHDMYCSASCREEDWSTHKHICEIKAEAMKAKEAERAAAAAANETNEVD